MLKIVYKPQLKRFSCIHFYDFNTTFAIFTFNVQAENYKQDKNDEVQFELGCVREARCTFIEIFECYFV